jgi:hypothetical protein
VQDTVQRPSGLGEEGGTLLGGEQGVGTLLLTGDVAQVPAGVAVPGLGRRRRGGTEDRAEAGAQVELALGAVDDDLDARRPVTALAHGSREHLAARDVDDLADAQRGQQPAGGGVGGADHAVAAADDHALLEPVEETGAGGRGRRGSVRGSVRGRAWGGRGDARRGRVHGITCRSIGTRVHRRRLPP